MRNNQLTVRKLSTIAEMQGFDVEKQKSGELYIFRESDNVGVVLFCGRYNVLYKVKGTFTTGMHLPNLQNVIDYLKITIPK